jgi:hypothetical protein
MEWIIENKDWLFSGIAISVPLAIVGWIISTRGNKQVGGNFKIGGEKDDD